MKRLSVLLGVVLALVLAVWMGLTFREYIGKSTNYIQQQEQVLTESVLVAEKVFGDPAIAGFFEGGMSDADSITEAAGFVVWYSLGEGLLTEEQLADREVQAALAIKLATTWELYGPGATAIDFGDSEGEDPDDGY